jgi:intraflagellar transport protein 81
MEEEAKLYQYLAMEKLPREIEEREKAVQANRRIVDGPAITQSDLDALQRSIQDATRSINAIMEQRLARTEGSEDKLVVFRKQAAIIASKKAATAERLKDLQVRRPAAPLARAGLYRAGFIR